MCCGRRWSAASRCSAPCRSCRAACSSVSRASGSRELSSHQSAARGSKGRLPTSRPAPATPSSTSHAHPTHLQTARMPCSQPIACTQSRLASRLASCLRPQAVILKYLHAPVVRVHDVHRIIAVDEKSRRKLKVSQPRATLAERVEQLPLAVEYLHDAPKPFDQVDVILGIDRDPFGPIYLPDRITHSPDLPHQFVLRIEDLYAEVHRVDHSQ